MIPFARTKAERATKGDPRRALDERHRDKTDSVQKVRTADVALQGTGYLLAEDVERIVGQAVATTW